MLTAEQARQQQQKHKEQYNDNFMAEYFLKNILERINKASKNTMSNNITVRNYDINSISLQKLKDLGFSVKVCGEKYAPLFEISW